LRWSREECPRLLSLYVRYRYHDIICIIGIFDIERHLAHLALASRLYSCSIITPSYRCLFNISKLNHYKFRQLPSSFRTWLVSTSDLGTTFITGFVYQLDVSANFAVGKLRKLLSVITVKTLVKKVKHYGLLLARIN